MKLKDYNLEEETLITEDLETSIEKLTNQINRLIFRQPQNNLNDKVNQTFEDLLTFHNITSEHKSFNLFKQVQKSFQKLL